MSTLAPTRAGLGPITRPAPAEVLLVRRLVGWAWGVMRWLWLLAALIVPLLTVVVVRTTTIRRSAWQDLPNWPRWWLFVAAGFLLIEYLPVVVAQGMPRRAATRALGVAGVLVSLLWAAFITVGFVVERVIYSVLDRPAPAISPHLFADSYDILPMFLEYSVTMYAYVLSGALIGGLYYRFGAIRGTVLLPAAGLPVLLVEALVSGWNGEWFPAGESASRPLAALLLSVCFAVLVLGSLGLRLALRNVAIRSKR